MKIRRHTSYRMWNVNYNCMFCAIRSPWRDLLFTSQHGSQLPKIKQQCSYIVASEIPAEFIVAWLRFRNKLSPDSSDFCTRCFKAYRQFVCCFHSLAAGLLFFVPANLFFHNNVFKARVTALLSVISTIGSKGNEPESSATCFWWIAFSWLVNGLLIWPGSVRNTDCWYTAH